ncbi:hypothetical protein LOTGIDRAFT_153662 [Lottia gigantea]|uniref:Protein rolling stone n=1 Tax=Lottia gigantea TaxID=225164 RepID=V4AD24_LOTGI|nr:hypothetical protein LOTGIDRAFT_153662 [Lottia gigantea]ESO91231.1 hypothetical protein LOTGIDRAFT_153662 [Lottia gigantea]
MGVFRQEFLLKNYLAKFKSVEPFYKPQWKWPVWVMLVYRGIFSFYTVFGLIYYLVYRQDLRHPTILYLATWAYIALTLYHLVALIVTSYIFAKTTKEEKTETIPLTTGSVNNDRVDEEETTANKKNSLPWYVIITWLLANVSYTSAITVTTVFYFALFPLGGVNTDMEDVNIHVFNTILVLVDVSITAIPVRLYHVSYTIIAGGVYSVMYEVYWNVNKSRNVLYPGLLDWNKPEIATMVNFTLLFIVLPLLQFMFFGFYRLRLFIFEKIYKQKYEHEP